MRLVIAVFLGGLLWTGTAHAGTCTLQDLHWMSGVWRADSAERQTEERWVTGPDGVLFGSSWTMAPGKPAFIESLMIGMFDNKPGMRLRHFARDLQRSMEDADTPMLFNLATCDAYVAVFEGQGNKVGERITYQRDGDQLLFTGDFLREGKPLQVKVSFRRSAD
jgi:hypothetical protein